MPVSKLLITDIQNTSWLRESHQVSLSQHTYWMEQGELSPEEISLGEIYCIHKTMDISLEGLQMRYISFNNIA